jgi:hypothetical protein
LSYVDTAEAPRCGRRFYLKTATAKRFPPFKIHAAAHSRLRTCGQSVRKRLQPASGARGGRAQRLVGRERTGNDSAMRLNFKR